MDVESGETKTVESKSDAGIPSTISEMATTTTTATTAASTSSGQVSEENAKAAHELKLVSPEVQFDQLTHTSPANGEHKVAMTVTLRSGAGSNKLEATNLGSLSLSILSFHQLL